MTTYEEFVKPHLKPKDGYEHVLFVRICGYEIGHPDKPKNYISVKNTEKVDEIMVGIQKDGYTVIDIYPFSNTDIGRAYIIIKYK